MTIYLGIIKACFASISNMLIYHNTSNKMCKEKSTFRVPVYMKPDNMNTKINDNF